VDVQAEQRPVPLAAAPRLGVGVDRPVRALRDDVADGLGQRLRRIRFVGVAEVDRRDVDRPFPALHEDRDGAVATGGDFLEGLQEPGHGAGALRPVVEGEVQGAVEHGQGHKGVFGRHDVDFQVGGCGGPKPPEVDQILAVIHVFTPP